MNNVVVAREFVSNLVQSGSNDHFRGVRKCQVDQAHAVSAMHTFPAFCRNVAWKETAVADGDLSTHHVNTTVERAQIGGKRRGYSYRLIGGKKHTMLGVPFKRATFVRF